MSPSLGGVTVSGPSGFPSLWPGAMVTSTRSLEVRRSLWKPALLSLPSQQILSCLTSPYINHQFADETTEAQKNLNTVNLPIITRRTGIGIRRVKTWIKVCLILKTMLPLLHHSERFIDQNNMVLGGSLGKGYNFHSTNSSVGEMSVLHLSITEQNLYDKTSFYQKQNSQSMKISRLLTSLVPPKLWEDFGVGGKASASQLSSACTGAH